MQTGKKKISKEKVNERHTSALLIDNEKKALAATITRGFCHEIKNPLTNIHLALEHLKLTMKDSSSSAKYLDVIQENAGRINQITDQLTLSCYPLRLSFREISLNQILDDALSKIKNKHPNLMTIKDFEKAPPKVYGSQQQLLISYYNILSNASDAVAGKKGLIRIRTFSSKDHCVSVIADNGEGIPQAQLKNIFDPFFTNKKNKTGLGLTIARNIIHGHRGQIKIESEYGKGTKCTIAFKKIKE